MLNEEVMQIIQALSIEGYDGGYVSIRSDKGMLINESNEFSDLNVDKIKKINVDNNVDLEKAIHLTIYEKVADVNSIIHLHPQYLSALSALSMPIHAVSIPDADGFGYKLPICLNNIYQVAVYLARFGIALTKNNGVYIGGIDGAEMVQRAVMAENAARNYLTALAIGEPRVISPRVAKKQYRIFKSVE